MGLAVATTLIKIYGNVFIATTNRACMSVRITVTPGGFHEPRSDSIEHYLVYYYPQRELQQGLHRFPNGAALEQLGDQNPGFHKIEVYHNGKVAVELRSPSAVARTELAAMGESGFDQLRTREIPGVIASYSGPILRYDKTYSR
jgi:hypothetical protein